MANEHVCPLALFGVNRTILWNITMKNLKRTDLSLPDYLAYCTIAAAIRPYRRNPYFAVGIVIPDWDQKAVYQHAAEKLLNPTDDFRIKDSPICYDSRRFGAPRDAIMEVLQFKRSLVLVQSADDLPEDLRLGFDAIVEVRRPTPAQMRNVLRFVYAADVDLTDAAALLSLDWDRLRVATRRGRPISRILAKLKSAPQGLAQAPSRGELDFRLEHMAGYGEARSWGLELARDLEDWRAGAIGWHDVDQGLLLSGPPGTGKTIYARALANTCGVKLIIASYARWQRQGYLNDFLKAMHHSFEDARKQAPAILFIDELDAFGDRLNINDRNRAYEVKTINALLEHLDGLEGREGVVVVGACNHPGLIDPAILRSGRLDRHVRIPLPDREAREAIARMHLRGDLSGEDFLEFSSETEGLTGADIARIIREARRIARRGRRAITADDIRATLPQKYRLPPENVRANAIHEIGHAVVGTALGMTLVTVAIKDSMAIGRGIQAVGGAVFLRPTWPRRTKEYYLDQIALCMSGMAAENVFLGSHDDGVAGGEGADLHEATKIAVAMERQFGMGDMLAAYAEMENRSLHEITHMDPHLMSRVDTLLREQLERARKIIERHRAACEVLAADLARTLELSGEEVLDAIDDLRENPASRKVRNR